jgi:hypothetical protein
VGQGAGLSRRLTYLRHIDARVEDGGCSSGRGRYKVAVQHVQRMIPGHRDRADRCAVRLTRVPVNGPFLLLVFPKEI